MPFVSRSEFDPAALAVSPCAVLRHEPIFLEDPSDVSAGRASTLDDHSRDVGTSEAHPIARMLPPPEGDESVGAVR